MVSEPIRNDCKTGTVNNLQRIILMTYLVQFLLSEQLCNWRCCCCILPLRIRILWSGGLLHEHDIPRKQKAPANSIVALTLVR